MYYGIGACLLVFAINFRNIELLATYITIYLWYRPRVLLKIKIKSNMYLQHCVSAGFKTVNIDNIISLAHYIVERFILCLTLILFFFNM